jgi:hypothetical protein
VQSEKAVASSESESVHEIAPPRLEEQQRKTEARIVRGAFAEIAPPADRADANANSQRVIVAEPSVRCSRVYRRSVKRVEEERRTGAGGKTWEKEAGDVGICRDGMGK